jgi:NAD(P)-dependent dehydrogenase (short-subunit alcohol dehydrogenase family)
MEKLSSLRFLVLAWVEMQRNASRFDILSPTLACQLSRIEFHIVKSHLFDLEGKVALVTGSTRGIGKSIAEELARAGAKVSVSSRKPEACEQVRAEFESQGFQVLAQPCNVSRKEDLQGLVDATRAKWGGIDVVVSNAASNPYYGPLTGISDEAFDKIITNNVKSVLWLAALTLEGMATRGGGSFIVVGSIGGLLANTVIGAYGVSKAADHHLVRNLAAEWGPKNVRVNAIAPGLVKTEFARALWEDEKRAAERIQATPLRRLGEPRDIGGIAVFLASEAAAFITGQCIVADGGVTIL